MISRIREAYYPLAALNYRETLLRHKWTLLGSLWLLIRPAISAIILLIVFSRVAKLQDSHVPYPLFILPSYLLWQWISLSIRDQSKAFLKQSDLVTKVRFPLVALVGAPVVTNFSEMLIGSMLFIPLAWYFSYLPGIESLLLIPLLLLVVCMLVGAGLVVAYLCVFSRDLVHVVDFGMQILFFISPVAYGLRAVPGDIQWLYLLNPLTGVMELLRHSLFGGELDIIQKMAIIGSSVFTLGIFAAGIFIDRRVGRRVVDYC